jgi:hypothetical protein
MRCGSGAVSDREREGRKWTWGQLTPAGLGPRAELGVDFSSEVSPGCEARFELHNQAWLRGYFRASWAGMRELNRANKHMKLG